MSPVPGNDRSPLDHATRTRGGATATQDDANGDASSAHVRAFGGVGVVDTAYSVALDDALAMSASAHRTQVRKGSGVPYVQHPVHVAIILLKHGFSEEIAIAGLLHDVVEDCDVELSEIRARFGDVVADLVRVVTETKTDDVNGAPRPWRVRKEEQIARLDVNDTAACALKAADALHNCSSTLRDLAREGSAAWRRFNAPQADQAWYYGEIARRVTTGLGDHPLARELATAVGRLSTWPS